MGTFGSSQVHGWVRERCALVVVRWNFPFKFTLTFEKVPLAIGWIDGNQAGEYSFTHHPSSKAVLSFIRDLSGAEVKETVTTSLSNKHHHIVWLCGGVVLLYLQVAESLVEYSLYKSLEQTRLCSKASVLVQGGKDSFSL